ncbi:MAG: CesT family type III secretion system chaperone [Bdellovibrionales bacterium]|nr:CesT family type III secretion system chaperone [Ramlibacter sp.]
MTSTTATCPAFAALAAALCKAARIAPPALAEDTSGGLGLRLELDGVLVTITHHPAQFPSHVFVYVAFGAVPASGEADAFRDLLDANLLMMRPCSPSFARDPLDGQIVLQACCALHETSGNALLAGIRVAVGKALEWRQAHRLSPLAREEAHAASRDYAAVFA